MMAKYTSIGGQALIEGILMKSPEKTALCVRLPDGSIDTSYMEEKRLTKKYKILGLPVIRGVVAFIESLTQGYKALMISADKSGFADLEEENTQKTNDKKENSALLNIVMIIGAVLGVLLSVVLFMYLPRLLVSGIEWISGSQITSKLLRSCIEQFVKLSVFVLYVWAVSFMKDIKRVFMYHGAEHKTIFCYEKGLELTVENVREQKRFHPRCGTSFMILMILISVIFSTVLQMIFPGVYTIRWLWVLAKILMIPLICGVGYEVLKICGRYDNILTRIISAPGMWLQRLTTKEPEDSMIEI
ncbi:MAG: DUF1385 domain-containing protein, partial [Ruminococcaceae bacterium]|nr:DUF1385 domain-containing protein [Oscillospiraceae bacterium]